MKTAAFLALLVLAGFAVPLELMGQDGNLRTQHVFPIYVDGNSTDGTQYRTTLVMQNPNVSPTASCQIEFHHAVPPVLRAPDNAIVSGFLISQLLPPGSFNSLQSTGEGALFSGGYFLVSCSTPIAAYAVYSTYRGTGPDRRLIAETTVNATDGSTAFQLVDDSRNGGRTALALANHHFYSVLVHIEINDIYGRLISRSQMILPGRSSTARFLNELLPAVPLSHVGVVRLNSSSWIFAAGLRFTGDVITTVPPATRTN